jgi:hypothetical protein
MQADTFFIQETWRTTDGKIPGRRQLLLISSIVQAVRICMKILPCVSTVRDRVPLRLTVGRSVCLGVEPRPGLMTRCLLTDSYGIVLLVRPV